MKTITEASRITGIIPQRINDYEKAGLLEKPAARNKYKYRQYGDKEIVRLWQIRFYKELGYTIPQMKKVFSDPAYRAEADLAEQVRLLEEKKQKIEALLLQAKALQQSGLDLSFTYEAVPGVNQLTYDEAAKITFPILSKALLEAVEEANGEAGPGDSDGGFYDDLASVLELFEDGCEPSGPIAQANLRVLKQRHGMPLASLRWMLEVQYVKKALLEACGNEVYATFRKAVRIAAEAESAEVQAQARISINRLVKMQSTSPEQETIQDEIAQFLRIVSYGESFPKDPKNPKDYEIEALDTLIQQYADRGSAVYAIEYQARLDRAARGGKAGPEAQAEAATYANRQHAKVTKTLVPALRVYLKNMKETAARRGANRQERNE